MEFYRARLSGCPFTCPWASAWLRVWNASLPLTAVHVQIHGGGFSLRFSRRSAVRAPSGPPGPRWKAVSRGCGNNFLEGSMCRAADGMREHTRCLSVRKDPGVFIGGRFRMSQRARGTAGRAGP